MEHSLAHDTWNTLHNGTYYYIIGHRYNRLIFASQVRFTGSNFFERKYEVVFWFHGKEYYASLPMSA